MGTPLTVRHGEQSRDHDGGLGHTGEPNYIIRTLQSTLIGIDRGAFTNENPANCSRHCVPHYSLA
jgi:hypothetical protein